MKEIYLDNASTTQVDDRVLEAMTPFFKDIYGNASSIHEFGQKAKEALENSRKVIATSLNCKEKEIVFTSGGTESNNFALKGAAFAGKGKHFVTSKIEHDCVLNSCKWLESRDYDITYLDVDKEGFVDLKQLEDSIREDTVMVSIIHGNNEVGTIQDIKKIGEICKKKKVWFHIDACQSYTKVPIDVKDIDVDLITINSHKIHGPKGVGALYIRDGISLTPLLHGGGHEFKKRSGTENVAGIVGFAKAVELSIKSDFDKIADLRDYMIERILKEIPDCELTGPRENRLCNNVNFIFNYIEGEGILMHLNLEGIAVSTGSACSSHTLEPSHVLIGCGYKHEVAHGSIRFSLSKYTTKEEIDYTINKLKEVVKKLREISPLKK